MEYFKFYNHMSNNSIQFLDIDLFYKSTKKENEEYLFIGFICPYNYFVELFILKNDLDKYLKLKKTNKEAFKRKMSKKEMKEYSKREIKKNPKIEDEYYNYCDYCQETKLGEKDLITFYLEDYLRYY